MRVSVCNGAEVNPDGQFVIYWMIAQRRMHWNFALDRAVNWAKDLKKPLVVLEALRCGYPWASDRMHRFVIEGMAANALAAQGRPVVYYPYVEPTAGSGKGLVEAFAAEAAVVVTDEFPCFFLPRMVEAVAARLPVRMEQVDGNGLMPLRATEQVFPTAYAFRRYLQRQLPQYLDESPTADPLARLQLPRLHTLPAHIARRWPPADAALLAAQPAALARLPIDHAVAPAAFAGGGEQAQLVLQRFLTHRLARYASERNQPDEEVSSGFSPYLHFGHLSVHQVFAGLAAREGWSPERLSSKVHGKREGWWGMSPAAESFLDELITWRELGYNFCSHRLDYNQYESLPAWSQATLEKHAADRREVVYSLAEFERAETHDPLWNAAQRQLVREGRMHNYLRMLWGKKILQWTASPREALAVMIELNNKYAVDGRNPNSYSGIFWVLGRYDRPWGPERPIFGTVRYMTSENTARKLRVGEYLRRYAPFE